MVSPEVVGIPLRSLEFPIQCALTTWSALSDGRIEFENVAASKLELTPDKAYSARSATPLTYEGVEGAASLCVIAFAPQDATGDDNTYRVGELRSSLPDETKYIPRAKAPKVDTEAHLPLLSRHLDASSEPVLFAGHLSVLGVYGRFIGEIGYLGQESHAFASTMEPGRRQRTNPIATLTTGYKDGLRDFDATDPRQQFGDPHAVMNRVEYALQVCAFIGISPAERQKRGIFTALNAVVLPDFP